MSVEPNVSSSESTVPSPESRVLSPESSVKESVTCLACGCLCDDIRVVVEDGRIVEAERACSIGLPWFLRDRAVIDFPSVTIDGQGAEPGEALDRAAEILRAAKSPFVWGLTETTIETVASALAIADRIGAGVDLASDHGFTSNREPFQRIGQVSASLGEVKDRADVVVFWGVDPLKSHPRHWERYSVEPKGRFIPEGRAGRFVIVVDGQSTDSSREADLFVEIDRTRQAETLRIVRSLLRGIKLDPDRSSRSAGISFEILQLLADHLKSARYGALFFDPAKGPTEPILELTRDLNDGRRFVALEMGSAGNPSGAASVLSWQAGAASAVDFGLGYPRHLPGEASLRDRVEEGTVDALLMVTESAWIRLGSSLLEKIEQIPTIVIGPRSGHSMKTAVSFDVRRPGIESGGTVARIDGVMLPLRPSLSSSLPTDRQILEAILERLESPQGRLITS